MASLPTDVIERILIGLPAFDLVRCKAVCKDWLSLISSADFVAAHLERAKSDPWSQHILVQNPYFEPRRPKAVAGHLSSRIRRGKLDLPRPEISGPFSSLTCFSSEDLLIVGLVNGLLCIAGKGEIPYVTLSPDDIWILNPVTGLSRKLPYSSRVFYDNHHNVKFAFWCDQDGAYNVAKILTDFNGVSMLELWVSTSPDAWTVIYTFESDFHYHSRRLHACDVVIEGLAAYWILVFDCGDDSDSDSDDGYSDDEIEKENIWYDDEIVVISLDFESLEVTEFVPLSNEELHLRKRYILAAVNGEPNYFLFGGNLNGEFVLVAHSYSDDGIEYGRDYDIWTPVMDDEAGTQDWVKKFRICLDSFPIPTCLGIVNDKLVLSSQNYMKLALYDPFTEALEVVETDTRLGIISHYSANGFLGSLVSIDGFGFEWEHILGKNMGISWPYSLHPSSRLVKEEEEGWRMTSCNKKQRRRY